MNTPTDSQNLVTADGIPLKVSLARAQRRGKYKAFGLVCPLFLFILISFFFPIGDMLFRSVENQLVGEVMHRTAPLLAKWDEHSGELPDEQVFAALAQDFVEARETKLGGKVGRRLNYESPGFAGLFRKTTRKITTMEAPYQPAFVAVDEKWGDIDNWKIFKRETGALTISYYLAAVDMGYASTGDIVRNDADQRIYLNLFWRTVWMSLLITVLCLILAYPIAYLLSVLPTAKSNLLIILVLLPFWTSLLVRTSAWIALLQQEGVINDLLVWLHLVDDNGRLAMIHNRAGTIIAMVHILLPFMVLPLYSVMKTIPPSYMRAAKSLGVDTVHRVC